MSDLLRLMILAGEMSRLFSPLHPTADPCEDDNRLRPNEEMEAQFKADVKRGDYDDLAAMGCPFKWWCQCKGTRSCVAEKAVAR